MIFAKFLTLLFVITVCSELTNLVSGKICPMKLPSSEAACYPTNNSLCFGTTLAYPMTSTHLAKDSSSNSDALAKLQLWAGLRNVPRCWDVIQPFLCAVYFPKCIITTDDASVSEIFLPSRELCDRTREPCKMVDIVTGWPEFMQCDKYTKDCNFETYNVRYNTTSTCQAPLIATSNPRSWYPGVDGCGLPCRNPFYTDEEHDQVHTMVAIIGCTCILCNIFTILTFAIDWSKSSRYPAVIFFFINGCFLIASVGWMAQFIPGARNDIVCRADGTGRKAEPQLGSGESAACAVVFVLVYGFTMAGITWFVILTYAWNLTYKALGSSRDVIAGRRGHFHLFAWSPPLVLTIVCLAVTQIDGDSMSGMCFVGYHNHMYRAGFLLLPIGLVLVVALVFLVKGIVTLVRIQTESPGLMSDKASARIRETIIRLGIFSGFAVVLVLISFAVHVYTFVNEHHWRQSFQDFIVCAANHSSSTQHSASAVHTATSADLGAMIPRSPCRMLNRPSVVAVQVNICAFFCTGIVMSSWVWNKATLKAWRNYLRKLFCNSEDMDLDAKKHATHDVVAQTSTKNRNVNAMRGSFSFVSNPVDPLAINYDLTSVSSHDFSSVWSAATQRKGLRRSGHINPATGRQRRFSDSDVQSISSIFEQLGFYDNDQSSLRRQLRLSHDASPVSTLAPPSSISSDMTYRSSTQRGKRNEQRVQKRKAAMLDSKDAADDVKLKIDSILAAASDSMGAIPCGSLDKNSVLGRIGRENTEAASVHVKMVDCGIVSNAPCRKCSPAIGEQSSVNLASSDAKKDEVKQPLPKRSPLGKSKPVRPNEKHDPDSDDDGTVENEEEAEPIDQEEEEEEGLVNDADNRLARAKSDYSIASSDTAALSIQLDSEYQPIDEAPPIKNVVKVAPFKSTGVNAVVTNAPPNIQPTSVSSVDTTHNSTQTPDVPSYFADTLSFHNSPPASNNFHQFFPPNLVLSNAQPPPMSSPYHHPYPTYPGFMPPGMGMPGVPPHMETPIWPPYGFHPYFYPYIDPRQFVSYPPSYYSHVMQPPFPPVPYDVFSPGGSVNTPHSSNHQPLPEGGYKAPTTVIAPPYPVSSAVPTMSVRDRGPTISRSMRSKLNAVAASAATPKNASIQRVDGLSGFKPSPTSQFRPLVAPVRNPRGPVGNSRGLVTTAASSVAGNRDCSAGNSLLEMVELLTPQLDAGTDCSNEEEEEEEGEGEGDEEERELEEGRYAAALREKRKASSINARMHEWLNSIEVGKEEEYSDTSF